MSLKKRILKNGIASGFQKIATILYQLLLVPFFIKYWGADYYGEWLTLTIIPSLLAFADFGFGSAAASSMVLAYADNKKQTFADMARTGSIAITGLILLILLLSSTGLYLLYHLQIFDKSLINANQAIIAVLMLIVSRALGFYHQLFEAYYRAAQKAHRSIYLLSFFQLSNIVFSIVVLVAGGNILAYSFVTLVLSILFLPLYTMVARKTLSLHRQFRGKYSKKWMKEFIHTGIGYLMSPIWQATLLQGTTFVVRITLGPVAVVVYSTVRTVSNIATQMVSILLESTFPDLQFELGAGRMANAQKIYKYVIIISAIVGLASSMFLMLFGEWFYDLWTAKALNPPKLMWLIFMASVVFKTVWRASSNIFRAFNEPFLVNVPCLIASVISVTLSYILIRKMGISGTAISVLLMDIILFLYIFPKSASLIGCGCMSIIDELRQTSQLLWSRAFRRLKN